MPFVNNHEFLQAETNLDLSLIRLSFGLHLKNYFGTAFWPSAESSSLVYLVPSRRWLSVLRREDNEVDEDVLGVFPWPLSQPHTEVGALLDVLLRQLPPVFHPLVVQIVPIVDQGIHLQLTLCRVVG